MQCHEMMTERLVLRRTTERDAAELVALMQGDAVLRQAAGMSERVMTETPEGFLRTLQEFGTRKRAMTWAVVLEERAIGTISLSDVDKAAGTGRVGYWIGSSHWRRGLATEAFRAVLELAREMGLRRLAANIAKDNVASMRMWMRYGATTTPVAGKEQMQCWTLDLELAGRGENGWGR